MRPDNPSFLPAELARDTVEALRQEQGPTTVRFYALLILGGFAALLSLPFVEVDRYVLAPGILQTETERARLRPAESGSISEVLVRENEPVRIGQPVLRLNPADLDQRLVHLRATQEEHALVASDLATLAEHLDDLSPWDPSKELGHGIGDRFSHAATKLRSSPILSEYRHFVAQLQPRLSEAKKAHVELERVSELARLGLVAPAEVETAALAFIGLSLRIDQMLHQTKAQWQNLLRGERDSLRALLNEEQGLLEAKKLRIVTAPIDGIVLDIAALVPGTYVLAGQDVGSISPAGKLIVQAYVPSRDIARLRPGQRARIEADAFPAEASGMIFGTVVSISDDRVESPLTATQEFRVTVHLDQPPTGPSTQQVVNLRKGLVVGVRLMLGRERLSSILLNRSADWISPFGRG